MKADRLEPGMPLRTDPPLFKNFSLKPVGLRTFRRQGRIGLINRCAEDGETARLGVAQNPRQPRLAFMGPNKKTVDTAAGFHFINDR
ncbi:MAG: hypothetical protein ACYC56_12465, partial [Candidatus Aquicultor sp.]